MGCGLTRNYVIREKTSTMPVFTIKDFLNILENLKKSVKNNLHTAKCRKFIIPETESKLFSVTIESLFDSALFGSSVCAEDMKDFMSDYKEFLSVKNFFFFKIHSACITDFCLEKAVLVFLIYSQSKSEPILLSKNPPFFSLENLKNNDEILTSWVDFAKTAFKCYGKYNQEKYLKFSVAKTQKIIKKYQGLADKNAVKRLKYLKEFLLLISAFSDDLSESVSRMRNIFEIFSINTKTFAGHSEDLVSLELTGEKIVHKFLV